MSELDKVQALYEELVSDFLGPLLSGGTVQATRALPPGVLEFFSLARPADLAIEGALLEALARQGAELAPVELVELAERGLMAVAIAVHDLFGLTDPQLDRAFARDSRDTVIGWVHALIDSIGVPLTRSEAIGRHVVLERALQLERVDTVVKNWAYTYRFYGRPPPANVVAMPRLRFVREETTHRRLLDLVMTEAEGIDLAGPLRALIARSPITQLLHHELFPELRFGQATLAVLSDSRLRSGVAQELVKRGTGHIAQPFGHALRVLSAQFPSPQHLYVAIALIADMQMLEVLDVRSGHTPRSEPAVGDEELFAAVLPALLRHRGALHGLVALSPKDAERVRVRAEEAAAQAGEDAVEMALRLIDRAAPLVTSPLRDRARDPTLAKGEAS